MTDVSRPGTDSEAAFAGRPNYKDPSPQKEIGDPPEAQHLAVMAQDGLARAIYPVHTPLDGDTVFAAATGRITPKDPILDMIALGTAAANALARACASQRAPCVYCPPFSRTPGGYPMI